MAAGDFDRLPHAILREFFLRVPLNRHAGGERSSARKTGFRLERAVAPIPTRRAGGAVTERSGAAFGAAAADPFGHGASGRDGGGTDPGGADGSRRTTDGRSIGRELGKSRREVLDLSLRNPLLNFRPSKRRGVEVVDERSRELFGILVGRPAGGASSSKPRFMRFLPVPEGTEAAEDSAPGDLEDVSPELLALLDEEAAAPGEAAARHTDDKLQTALPYAGLGLRLRETYRHARRSLEEQGVNILYLALGTLKWRESESSGAERRAPLILVPVKLEKSGVRESFKLAWTGDEIEANLSLETKLRQDFDVRLPQMPSEEDLDVEDYLSRVEEAVAQRPRWAVARDEVHLNFFSFSKLLIYKDLDAEVWPEGSGPDDHPLVRQLFGGDGFAEEPPAIGENEHIDDARGVADLHPVMDADSSQTLAVLDAIQGRNLVIQGPPGTGKSQTIANLIGEALAHGRTVLFVAEKRAALEVVKRRLDSIHLGDACLELHSHKTNKRAVLDELKRTLAMGRPRVARATEDEVLLEEARDRLNDYARAINAPVGRSGLSPHELVGRLAKLEQDGLTVDGPGLALRDSASWSREDFVRRREAVRELQVLVGMIGVPSEHVWWPCGRLRFVPTDEHSVRRALEEACDAVRRLEREAGELIGRVGRARAFREVAPREMERTIRTARTALEAPPLAGADHRSPDWVVQAERVEELAAAAHAFAEIRARHDAALIPEAWDRNVLEERRVLRAYERKWWRALSGTFRGARREIAGLCRGDAPRSVRERIELADAILEAGRLRREIEEADDLTGRLFPGSSPGGRAERHRAFAEAAAWLVQLGRDEAAGLVDEEVHDLLDRLRGRSGGSPGTVSSDPFDSAGLRAAADACERTTGELEEALEALQLRADRTEPGESPQRRAYGALDRWLRAALGQVSSVHDVVRFNLLEKNAAYLGIPEVAEAAATRSNAADHLTRLFEHSCYTAWLDAAFGEREALAQFDGATHAGIVDRFRELDMAQFHRNRARIAERHWERLPRHRGGGQLGVLLREFQKKSRHMAVRELVLKAGRAIQGVKPVFMMSPLSIAKYLPPGSIDFDMVVFDEASQVRPVEALGAIMRGKQAVVVGDSKQLPPTNFFDQTAEEEEGEDASRTADLESVLGLFCAQGAPERMLRWHYRSRHESLIAVSNHEFYDGRLVVFPSPDAGKIDTGLVFRHNPDAAYKRKGVNVDEAKTVAAAAMEHARENPELTLGVAAFGNAQARRIEDEVDILRRRDPSLEEFFAGHPEEPFFVKNLESVQGDERDVILISVGYGKIDGGHLPMNFGPLNQDGGERRLNVLITRARRRCVVHCNFVGADLDLRRSGSRGVQAFKTFLEYAQHGTIDVPTASGRGADSPFEEAVAAKLRDMGHDVEHQVGSAGFFVDLAVVDPERPGRYLLGIECDGATYHSSRSARDRDRLRQQVLEGLGWRIHRIWSTDWFRHPLRELAQVAMAIRSAELGRAPRSAPKPAPPEPLDRVSEPEPEIAVSTAPHYRMARLEIGRLDAPLHQVPTRRIAKWIARVVEVESPVHFQEVVARIRQAAKVRRVGERIRTRIRQGARQGARTRRYGIDESDFFWRLDREGAEVRRRDGDVPGSLRDPERIASEEIETALIRVVQASYGIEPADATKEAIRLFGFKRSGSKIHKRFREVLDDLVARNVLLREGPLLQAASRAEDARGGAVARGDGPGSRRAGRIGEASGGGGA